MTTVEILCAAQALVGKGWCQGEYTAKIDGKPIAWCARGAVLAVCPTGASDASWLLWNVVNEDIVHWNDAPGRTQAEVIQAFDRAIELAEAKR